MASRAALLLLLLAVQRAGASVGDAQPAFQRCLAGCGATGCAAPGACVPSCAAQQPDGLAPALRLLRWDCEADCRYRCMHAVEAQQQQRPPVKYYGKWPFLRVLGMQEPASVLGSVANLWAHRRGWARLRASLPPAHPLRPLWRGYAALSANAWLWSAVFHCRDTRLTERLDYFSADALLAYALFAALVRAGGLHAAPRRWAPLAAALGAALALHVHRMLTVRFDYGLNVALCVAAGVAHSLVWAAAALRGHHPARARLLGLLAAAHAASLLEVLDFAPLRGALDAHALWHAATPPLTLGWYAFLADDARLLPAPGKDKR